MPSDLELFGRLLLAALLGGAIGAERELADQPAGLRTHMLLTVGACLFTLVSAYGFGGSADPSRLAAQIVTGIGFLGGGAIVRYGLTVRGLTTAASIWATASIGVTVGAGRYLLAGGATLLVVVTLVSLRTVRDLLRRWSVSREEFVLLTHGGFDVKRVADLARREGVAVRGLELEERDGGGRVVWWRGSRPAIGPTALSRHSPACPASARWSGSDDSGWDRAGMSIPVTVGVGHLACARTGPRAAGRGRARPSGRGPGPGSALARRGVRRVAGGPRPARRRCGGCGSGR